MSVVGRILIHFEVPIFGTLPFRVVSVMPRLSMLVEIELFERVAVMWWLENAELREIWVHCTHVVVHPTHQWRVDDVSGDHEVFWMLDLHRHNARNRVISEPDHVVVHLDVETSTLQSPPCRSISNKANRIQGDLLVSRRASQDFIQKLQILFFARILDPVDLVEPASVVH